MENSFGARLKHAWNAFLNRDPTATYQYYGNGYSYRPDRIMFTRGNERSIITAIYNRIALDVASTKIVHCKLDDKGRYVSDVKSHLNDCLTLEANIDQTGRAFIHDIAASLLDEGCVAIVPVETDLNPEVTGSYDILSMRTGKILEWYPSHVKVKVYNEKKGCKEDLVLPKSMVGIVENPHYAVMNELNTTLKRLVRKLNLSDTIDEQTGSNKLDLIIQLPYVVKTPTRKQQAEERLNDIKSQLSKSDLGIAYTDGTERITQLNRPVENTLLNQIKYLSEMLYSQLGLTQSILDGSADESTMQNYYDRTIEPIVAAIVDEMKRKFLTKTARTKGHSIVFFRDPFKLIPITKLAEIADKMTRNEIMSSNEIRQKMGMKPSSDPKADQLTNSNISQPNSSVETPKMIKENQNGEEEVDYYD